MRFEMEDRSTSAYARDHVTFRMVKAAVFVSTEYHQVRGIVVCLVLVGVVDNLIVGEEPAETVLNDHAVQWVQPVAVCHRMNWNRAAVPIPATFDD